MPSLFRTEKHPFNPPFTPRPAKKVPVWYMDIPQWANRQTMLFYRPDATGDSGMYIIIDAKGVVRTGLYQDACPYITDGLFLPPTFEKVYQSQTLARIATFDQCPEIALAFDRVELVLASD